MENWAETHLLIGLGKLELIDDSGPVQLGQVRLSASEVRDGMPIPNQFGFQSSAPTGSDVVHVSMDAQRSKSVVVGTNHQASRLKNLAPGGTRMHDQGGVEILIGNDGSIKISAPGEALHPLLTQLAAMLFNTHTHPGNGQPPTQQMTAAHWTTATRAGT
jgi:phage gp45-like